jgi:tetratricopeptide (TPR) repeat protein
LGAAREALSSLAQVAAHPEAPPLLRLEALGKMVELHVQRGELDRARAAAALAQEVSLDQPVAHELRLAIDEAVGDFAGAAATIERLVATAPIDEERRSGLLLRLAAIEEEKLSDVVRAIDTLGRVRAPTQQRAAIERLLALGEKTGRWDLAASALEAALDRGKTDARLDPAWELAIRTRLAVLLEGPLQRPEAAVRQYERIVALDPEGVAALERLAELAMSGPPARAIEHHRALLMLVPLRVESYRALRKLFLAAGDDDGAFLSEAVLEGLGRADEEEAYFSRQRRTRLLGEVSGALTDEERRLLCPILDDPQLQLLGALSDALRRVFPIDFDGYGIAAEQGVIVPGAFRAAADRVARLFLVPAFRLELVANRLGPTCEPGATPLVLVPRALEDAVRREQLFIAGQLFGRISMGGAVLHEKRISPLSPQLLDHLLWAAGELYSGVTAPARGKPIFDDIRRRLQAALDPAQAAGGLVSAAAHRLFASGGAPDGDAVRRAITAASMRAGVLAAQDPAVAIAHLRERGAAEAELSAALRFVVSAGHMAVRRRLGLEVKP